MSTPRKPWPHGAENDRMDALALLMDIAALVSTAGDLASRGRVREVLAVLQQIRSRAERAQNLLRQARDRG